MLKHPEQFDCRKCPRNHHCDETGEWPGSNGPAGYVIQEIPGVIQSRTCLLPRVTEYSMAMRKLYRHYRNHILPFPGALLEQPNPYLECMEILDTL